MQVIRSRRPSSLTTTEAAPDCTETEAREEPLGESEHFRARGESAVQPAVSRAPDASDLLKSSPGLDYSADFWISPAETSGSPTSPQANLVTPGESPADSEKSSARGEESPPSADYSPADMEQKSAYPTEISALVSGKRRAHMKYEGRTIEAAAQGRGAAQLRGARTPIEFVDASRQASPLHKKGFLGSGVRVAVFDTGRRFRR